MRFLKLMVVIAVCVLGTSLLLSAKQNQYGVADSRQITFDTPMRVGDVLLPSGEYQVLHTMDGDTHVMVFKQLKTKNPSEAKIKCQIVPLQAKADQTQKTYIVNASNERVLQTLVFRGDTAKHVF
ncbi:MAG TPA: hypothetical protein VH437_23470 [Terriglobales bacterium]|jgi:hypothetical protein